MATHSIDSIDITGIGCHLTALSPVTIGWNEITWIGAFKRVEKTGSFVCIWIRTPRVEFPVEIDERDPKWVESIAAMTIHLPGFRPLEKWFPPNLHPSLEINMQNIYEPAPDQSPPTTRTFGPSV